MRDVSHEQETASGADESLRQKRIGRFSVLVTLALILACNGTIVLGIWASGTSIDSLFGTPDLFNPTRDMCLRYTWRKVSGVQQPVRLCYEWINFSDPSGNTHTFQTETDIVLGADGKLHYDHGAQVDSRLLLLLAFAATVLAGGVVLSRSLISRYRARVETSHPTTPS